MDYINSIRRVQKTDLDDFFGQIKQLREKEAVSPEEEKELRKYATELNGDEKKCVDRSSGPPTHPPLQNRAQVPPISARLRETGRGARQEVLALAEACGGRQVTRGRLLKLEPAGLGRHAQKARRRCGVLVAAAAFVCGGDV